MKIKQYNAKYYSQDELEAVIEVFKETPVKIPVLISMLYGFRRSEVLGLKWDSIDLKNKSITVKKTVCRGNLDGEVKFLIKDRTKTKAGLRTLPLIPLAEKILLEEFERQQSQKTENTEYSEYICQDDKGELMKPDYVSKKFKKILIKNDIRVIRFHDLRHSCATLLVSNGIPLKDVQIWLGHSNYQSTLRYSHLENTSKIASANLIDSTLGRVC